MVIHDNSCINRQCLIPNCHLTQSSNHSRVVIYSLVIRSFSTLFPFQKGKNEGNTLEIDRIKNDATPNP